MNQRAGLENDAKLFIEHDAIQLIENAKTLLQLESVKVLYLGKKGILTEQLKQLSKLSDEERPQVGQAINQAKQRLLERFEQQYKLLQAQQIEAELAKERIDVSLQGRGFAAGSFHPITQTRQRVECFFSRVGFEMVEGPEIEDDFHNFAALNIPLHHPARAAQDTFYLESQPNWLSALLLRTHTSSVQIRTMEKSSPPLRVITPGRVYRCDSDLTHTPMFHQVEGLVIDEHSSFADLKGLLLAFMRDFFQKDLSIRFRASYFPFTEPSAEVDIQCVRCSGGGCRICKMTGWLEVLGCGMVHPNVLAAVGIDSEKYSGYAFGVGMDRLTMLRFELSDLRMLFENDQRLLEQFA
jgi:phenylalanyl-tRNA synthetase alpha chain